MLCSSERQVRSSGCMLNTVKCETNNWSCSFTEMYLAGQVWHAGTHTALNLQLSVRRAMETHDFNYVFKTLTSASVLQVLLHRE